MSIEWVQMRLKKERNLPRIIRGKKEQAENFSAYACKEGEEER